MLAPQSCPSRASAFFELLAAQVLADGDIFHLGGDDAPAGIVHLRDVLPALARSGAVFTLGNGGTPPERSGPSWPLSSGFTSRAE
jgi:hypothetical protein